MYIENNEVKNKISIWLLVMFLLIVIPTKYEWRFISPKSLIFNFKEKKTKLIFSGFYYYFIRVRLFYKLWVNKIQNKKFDLPFFKSD